MVRYSCIKQKSRREYRKTHNFNEIGDKKPGWAKHLSALQIRHVLGNEEYSRCFKFSIVRNPWARMVSRYYFTHTSNEPSEAEKIRRHTSRKFHNLTFDEWIQRQWERHLAGKGPSPQLQKLVDEEANLLVDHVGKLENVQQTLDWISNQCGLDRLEMPHRNGTHKQKGHYSEYYNAETREKVYEMCKTDIEYFGYSFQA